jgi:hypothetical protein
VNTPKPRSFGSGPEGRWKKCGIASMFAVPWDARDACAIGAAGQRQAGALGLGCDRHGSEDRAATSGREPQAARPLAARGRVASVCGRGRGAQSPAGLSAQGTSTESSVGESRATT